MQFRAAAFKTVESLFNRRTFNFNRQVVTYPDARPLSSRAHGIQHQMPPTARLGFKDSASEYVLTFRGAPGRLVPQHLFAAAFSPHLCVKNESCKAGVVSVLYANDNLEGLGLVTDGIHLLLFGLLLFGRLP